MTLPGCDFSFSRVLLNFGSWGVRTQAVIKFCTNQQQKKVLRCQADLSGLAEQACFSLIFLEIYEGWSTGRKGGDANLLGEGNYRPVGFSVGYPSARPGPFTYFPRISEISGSFAVDCRGVR